MTRVCSKRLSKRPTRTTAERFLLRNATSCFRAQATLATRISRVRSRKLPKMATGASASINSLPCTNRCTVSSIYTHKKRKILQLIYSDNISSNRTPFLAISFILPCFIAWRNLTPWTSVLFFLDGYRLAVERARQRCNPAKRAKGTFHGCHRIQTRVLEGRPGRRRFQESDRGPPGPEKSARETNRRGRSGEGSDGEEGSRRSGEASRPSRRALLPSQACGGGRDRRKRGKPSLFFRLFFFSCICCCCCRRLYIVWLCVRACERPCVLLSSLFASRSLASYLLICSLLHSPTPHNNIFIR